MKRTLLIALASWIAGCQKPPAVERPPEDQLWVSAEKFARGSAHVEPARKMAMSRSVLAAGRIAFNESRLAHVTSPVSGHLTRIVAQLGARVHKGSPLAIIVSPDVGSAVSDEVKARADEEAALRDFQRQQRLLKENAASSRDFEAAEDTYRKAQAEEARALERLRLLQEGKIDSVTQEYTLPSPIDGVVVARMVNPGVFVQGQYSGGSPSGELFTIGNIEDVWLYADVAESDLELVKPGAKMSARVLAYPGQEFAGRVEWVSPVLDPVLRTARVRCSLPNPDRRLKPEMFGAVSIERPAETQLAVPATALTRIEEQSFVYVAAGERPDHKRIFQRRHVQTPDRDGPPEVSTRSTAESALASPAPPQWVPVLGGLLEGEAVLIEANEIAAEPGPEPTLTSAQLASGKIQIAVAEEHQIHDALTIGGRVTFDDLRVTHVFSPVNGRIKKVLAEPGQRVKKNEPLAIIESPDLGTALSDLLKAKADLLQAEHEASRQRELVASTAGAARDLEAAEDNLSRAKAEFERAQERTRLLKEGASDSLSQEFVLRSPMDGEVIARMTNPGSELQGQLSSGGTVQELFTIGSTSELWLLGEVYERELPLLSLGASVELSLQTPSGPHLFHGTVDWISDTLDPVLRTAKVRCVLHNEQGLLHPEMYQVVRVTTPPRQAVTIPRDAILRLGEETAVFVEGDTRQDGLTPFSRRVVSAEEQWAGDNVPVRGLAPGERVASVGSIFLVGN